MPLLRSSMSRRTPTEQTRLVLLAGALSVSGLWLSFDYLRLFNENERQRREIKGMRMEQAAMASEVYVWPVDVCMVAGT